MQVSLKIRFRHTPVLSNDS